MAMKENSPNKLLRENKIPKIKANPMVSFKGGLVLKILKKRYPIRIVSNKKLAYPTGIRSVRFSSDLKIFISSFHNDANIEAWNRKSTPINIIQASKIANTYLFIFISLPVMFLRFDILGWEKNSTYLLKIFSIVFPLASSSIILSK